MCLDIKNFYLCAPLERYEYMRMPLDIFPEHIVEQYDLKTVAYHKYIYLEIRRSINGLPQAGALANAYLSKKLAPAGYYEVPHTPGLWKHVARPIQFSLVVDDFGVKYVGRENAEHLINNLQKDFSLSEDWDGALYCGITLQWDYKNRDLFISMPGYVEKTLKKYKHPAPITPQHSPYPIPPRKYGKESQVPDTPDTSPLVSPDEKKRVQQIVCAILYYARAIDSTVLPALSTIASEQTSATKNTIKNLNQLLDYLHTHPKAKIKFSASDMILNVHSDASYLSVSKARSRAAGIYFLSSLPTTNKPIKLNGFFHVLSSVLKFVAASAAEAELGALFHNIKEARIMRLTLKELGHPQPPTPIHCDNSTAVGIVNNTVKKHRSRSMEMRYFYACDQVHNGYFNITWNPGAEILADYPSKHHDSSHHQKMRPFFLHENNSPRFLAREPTPQTLRSLRKTNQ